MTAVEYIREKLLGDEYWYEDMTFDQIIEQAKEMEKQQIVEAFFQGVDRESDGHGAMYLSRKDAEDYYNQTFKSE